MSSFAGFRLYRIPSEGRVAGVCAGVAEYFGLGVGLVRVLTILGTFLLGPMIPLVYVILAVILPVRAPSAYVDEVDLSMSRAAHVDPHGSVRRAAMRLQEVEERLARVEAAVVDEDNELRRKFRDLR